LLKCPTDGHCRNHIMRQVREECCRKIQHLGDMFGRERLQFTIVAFGPPRESYVAGAVQVESSGPIA
jgi:hypothetical protein